MIVDVSTVLNCSAAKAWNEVQKSSLHRHVIRPLARLVPVDAPLPERWSEGHTIQCKLFVFGVIPIGVRTLHFEKIDHKNYQIQSREHDPLIARWDHLVSIKPLADTQSIYRDTIDICRQPHLRGLGMGQLVLPTSPTPVACACEDIVTTGGSSAWSTISQSGAARDFAADSMMVAMATARVGGIALHRQAAL